MLYSQTFWEKFFRTKMSGCQFTNSGQKCQGDNLQIQGKNDRVTIYKYALTDYDFKAYKV